MRTSIAFKIFAIAFIVTLVMTAISLFNLTIASRASNHMSRVINEYVEIYASIARLNVKSLEQAIQLRDFLLTYNEKGATQSELETLTQTQNGYLEQFDREFTTVTTLIEAEINTQQGFLDAVTIARVDERLKHIKSMEEHYVINHQQIMDLIVAHKPIPAAMILDHAAARIERIAYIDDTRKMMLTATRAAGAKSISDQEEGRLVSLILLTLVGILTAIASVALARQLARPVRNLLEGTRSVTKGDLSQSLPVTSSDEIGRLTQAFNAMIEDLSQGRQAQATLGQFVDPRIVKALIETPELASIAGGRRVMTIMFCDLKGFTNISESMTPTGLVTVINRYFTLMTEAIHSTDGVIDKFIGDAVMAYWGTPFIAEENQAQFALLSALTQLDKMRLLEAELPDLLHIRKNLPHLEIRIGIATGEVVVGSIGSELMRSYTVMGDAVNLASRLESANKLYGTHTLIDQETASRIDGTIVLREIDMLQVVGQSKPVKVFEIMGLTQTLSTIQQHLCQAYANGLDAYRECKWEQALSSFNKALELCPDDGPSKLFVNRLNTCIATPPPPGWDGTWMMQFK